MAACRAEMERESAEAAYRRLHEKRPWHDGTFRKWAEEPSAEYPYHFMHGVRIWVTEADAGFGGDFTRFEDPFKKSDDGEEEQRGDSS